MYCHYSTTDAARRCRYTFSVAGPSSSLQQHSSPSTCWAVLVSVCGPSSGGDAGGFRTRLPAGWRIATYCASLYNRGASLYRSSFPCRDDWFSRLCHPSTSLTCLSWWTIETHTTSWVASATTGCWSSCHLHTSPVPSRARPLHLVNCHGGC